MKSSFRLPHPALLAGLSCSLLATACAQTPPATVAPAVVAAPFEEAAPLPVVVANNDTNLRYIGRFDWRDAAGPRCSWSASTVALKFRGTALNAQLNDNKANRWQVEVDGQPTVALTMVTGTHWYRVASDLAPGEHTVELVRATEAFNGPSQFLGFGLSEGGQLLPLAAPAHRFEIIGDSISCGYGIEAASKDEKFSSATENAYFTAGAIVARKIGADFTDIAWSGRKMWPNNTVPEIYDLAIPTDTSSTIDFSKRPAPDLVLINLSTNDFGAKEKPDEEGWVKAYRDFVVRVRKNAPDATIYCAGGPMLSDQWPPEVKMRSLANSYIQRVVKDSNDAGDAKVRFFEFDVQDPANGLGASWHPNLKTNQIMAEKLLGALNADLGLKTLE